MTEDGPVFVGRRRRRRTHGDAIGGSRAFSWLLVITGAAGLLASWVITIDKFK
ncbi:vitamin K epoxide reductase family protein, partial [Streptomyces sp. NPDC002402]